jgi:hypothetical protein
MEVGEGFVNKVAQSGLITFDIAQYKSNEVPVEMDMKDHLFQGLILREKDFRAFVNEHDWTQYNQKMVAVFCSADAIVPTWAYMLLSVKLSEAGASIFWGTLEEVQRKLLLHNLSKVDYQQFKEQKMVVKGCADVLVNDEVYMFVTQQLMPFAQSIMYGEPCSTVPLFKRKS